MKKRSRVDPVEALRGAASTLALPVQVDRAVAKAENAAGERYIFKDVTGTLSEPKARLVYFQNPDNTLTLTWRVETDISENWLLSYVDAVKPKEVLGVVDFVSSSSYNV